MFLLPVIVIGVIYGLYQRRNKRVFGAVSFLICVYVFMGISAIALYLFFGYGDMYRVRAEPMIYLSVCLCLAFSGLFSYSDKSHRILIIENVVLMRWLERFQIVTSAGALVFFLPFSVKALIGDIGSNRLNFEPFRDSLALYGLINSFFSLVGNLFPLSILLAFVNLATIGRGGSTRRAKILLLLSSVYIVYVFAYVGRDGLVYWVFSLVFLYLLVKGFIPTAKRRTLKNTALIVAVPAIIGFSLITTSRFSGEDKSVLSSLFVYAGSQVFNFNEQYLVDAPPMMGLLYFHQIVELVDRASGTERQPIVSEDWWENYTAHEVEPWNFATFLGSFMQDFSRWGALLLTIVIAILTRASLRKQARTGVFDFSSLLYFVLLSQIVLFGVFYYRQGNTAYVQIGIIILAITFRLLRSEGQQLVIETIPQAGSPYGGLY